MADQSAQRMQEIIDRLRSISATIASDETVEPEVEELVKEAADLTAESVSIVDRRATELERSDD